MHADGNARGEWNKLWKLLMPTTREGNRPCCSHRHHPSYDKFSPAIGSNDCSTGITHTENRTAIDLSTHAPMRENVVGRDENRGQGPAWLLHNDCPVV